MSKLEKYLMENEFDYEWFMAEFKPVEIPKEFDYANELIIFTDGYLFSFECRKVDKDRFYEWNDDKKEFIKVDSLNDIQQAMDFIDEQADEAHTEMSKKVIDIKTLRKLENLNKLDDLKKLDRLEDILLEKYNMELHDDDKPFISIEDNILGYERCINDKEFEADKERLKEEVKLFEKFIDRNLYCTLCKDASRGGLWGLGYAIVNANLKLIDFVTVL